MEFFIQGDVRIFIFCVFFFDQESVILYSGVLNLFQDLLLMINNFYLSDVIINLRDGYEIVVYSFILFFRFEVLVQVFEV